MRKNIKGMGAALLSLCMLCSLLFSVTVLPAAADTADTVLPEAFEVDFADLAAQVDPADFADGVYTSTATDQLVNQWFSTHFDIYATLQGGSVRERAYLGQNSQAMESDNMSWGGIHRWVIAENGYLQHTVTSQGGEMLRKGEQMVLKTASGAQAQMENFEATVVFNTMANGCGAIALSFHEKTPGRVINNVTANLATSNAVIIGNGAGGSGKTDTDGVMIRKNGCAHSKTNIVDTATGLVASERFATAFAKNTDYVLYVKVVAGTVTVKVTSVDGATEFYNKTFENAVESYNGTISVGAANANRAFKSIVVRELDAEGNYVAFGSNTTNVSTFTENFNNLWEFSGNKYVGSRTDSTSDAFYWNLTDANVNAAAKEEVVNVLNLKFNEYMDFYGGYEMLNFGTVYKTSFGETASFQELLSNNTFQRVATPSWNRNMRLISSMVPKSERTGKELKMTNMEASFGIYWDSATAITSAADMNNNTAPGAVIFGFRQQMPGAFTLGDGVLRQDTAFVVISQTGFTVMGGNECAGSHPGLFNTEADEYSFFDYNTGYTTESNAQFTVKIRAVGDDLKILIKKSDTEIFNNFEGGAQQDVVINVGGFVEEGTVAFAVGEKKAGLRALSLTRLDDDGNPINLDADPAAFEVDFSELAQITYADGTYDANGLYASKYDDDDINDWVNERFDIYLGREGQATSKLMYFGQSSYALYGDRGERSGWGGEHKWQIDADGYARYSVSNVGGEVLRKGEQLVLKTDDGVQAKLENFKATIVFNTVNNDRGAVLLSFHEQVTGRAIDNGDKTQFSYGNTVIVGNANKTDDTADAMAIRKSGNLTSKSKLLTAGTYAACGALSSNFADNTDYKLIVKVVGSTITAKVTTMTGAVLAEQTLTDIVPYLGTISVGVSNSDRALKSIKVVELDENGDEVPFGTATTGGIKVDFDTVNLLKYNDGTGASAKYFGSAVEGVDDSTTVNTLSSSITDETKAELKYLLRSKFREYHDAVGNYLETDFEKVASAGTSEGVTDSAGNKLRDNAGFWQVWNGQWLQRPTENLRWQQNMRLISSLAPIDEKTNEPLTATDFETTFTVRFESASTGSAVFGFRQAQPGKFTYQDYRLVQEQAFITITGTGISFGAGAEQIPATKDTSDTNLYNTDAFYSFADGGYTAGSYPVFTITVKAVGDSAYLKIVDSDGTVVFNNFAGGAQETSHPMDLSGRPEEGYIAYGIGESQASIGSIQFTELVTDTEKSSAGTVTVKDYTAKDGKQAIVVEGEEGFELKAGSLKAIDEDGNVYVPTRVGFREDATITDRYEIPTDDPVVLVYEFVKPTLKAPNIGNIGTSINQEADGLRFVSRFTRVTKDDGKEYLVLGGTEYEIADYGMLVAFASVVEANDGVLDIALSETYSYVKKISIYKETKLYYDLCDAHVDTSVCIIGLDNVTDGRTTDITARPFVTVLVDGQEQTLYADAFTSNYTANV